MWWHVYVKCDWGAKEGLQACLLFSVMCGSLQMLVYCVLRKFAC